MDVTPKLKFVIAFGYELKKAIFITLHEHLFGFGTSHPDILGSRLDQTSTANHKHWGPVHFVVCFMSQPILVTLRQIQSMTKRQNIACLYTDRVKRFVNVKVVLNTSFILRIRFISGWTRTHHI